MRIGILHIELFIPEANSLKSKRQILKGLKEKIRRRFNVSVAESSYADKWQRQTLAVGSLSSDGRLVNSVLSKVVDLVNMQSDTVLIDYSIKII